MKRSTYLFCAVVLTVVSGTVRAQFHTMFDDIDWSQVDTAPGYVKRLTAVIKGAQEKHQAIITFTDSSLVALNANTLAELDLSPIQRYGRLPASIAQKEDGLIKQWGPDVRNGILFLMTNLPQVSSMIKTAREKHMIIVVDSKVADSAAVAALKISKIAKATLYEHGDSMAVDLYGPEVKDGFLLLTTRTHQ